MEDIEQKARERYLNWLMNNPLPFSTSQEYGFNSGYDLGFEAGKQERDITLPSVDEAGVIALRIIESTELNAQERALVVAGFQECIKYLENLSK